MAKNTNHDLKIRQAKPFECMSYSDFAMYHN